MNSAAVAMREPSMRSSGLICRELAQGVQTKIGTSWACRMITQSQPYRSFFPPSLEVAFNRISSQWAVVTW
jgi:hypothetical protein